ncbi:hypothetical protein ABEB36_009089 [Hypothenemus hampei]|uniref:Meiosis protein 5 homolog n=1 Tax=Hypothenemus hampei TaxID=57062 RepID=A0ABD1EPM5_HYPHA
MSTPNEKLPSQNFISNKINRSLLTPCRRIGLSRSKKTPNIFSTSSPYGNLLSQITPISLKNVETSNESEVQSENSNPSNKRITSEDQSTESRSTNADRRTRKRLKLEEIPKNNSTENLEDSSSHVTEGMPLAKFTTEEYVTEISKELDTFEKKVNEQENYDLLKITQEIKTFEEKVFVTAKKPVINVNRMLPLKQDKQKKLTIVKKVSSAASSSNSNEDIDDDMFTSSPESITNQRNNLIKIIKDLEKKSKEKQDTLDRLKRAQIYRNLHNPDQLKVLSNQWLEGCQKALSDLLLVVQKNEPMEMNVLLENLQISSEMIEKLKLI